VLLHTGIQDGFKLSPASLQAALGPRTKVLILNSPCNPTGVVYTPAELQALAEVCVQHGCYILFDEIYEHLVYDQAQHVTLASLSPAIAQRTLTVSGFSKSFSMTGWRLGTLVAPPAVAQAAEKLQSHICSNATSFAQYGALAALRNKPAAQAFLTHMRETFDRRRRLLFDGLQGTPGLRTLLPQGAFYLFPCIEGLRLDSLTFASRLLEEEKVALVPGAAFGSPYGLRLSYATSEATLTSGIQRIRRFCERLAQGDLAS
jgi:aspartate aminotransferase